ncbi:MAG: putative toxin-antitoxin system toxin component, PIN family [Bacteroidales bacterium]|nr:putative toxin-antitoxin system toxin component, PIN family [Bacteroidales bacterium]
MKKIKIVLDTNCLLASISSKSENYRIWKGFQQGLFVLCVSNEILEEYEEIIAEKANAVVAGNIINAIVESEFVEFSDPQFRFELITSDKDDNKFIDCAIAANATYIVSEDKHFDVLKEISFPKLLVVRLKEFLEFLTTSKE